MRQHDCARVRYSACRVHVAEGGERKVAPPPQPQNLFVYVLLRTVLRESARLVWQTEFQSVV